MSKQTIVVDKPAPVDDPMELVSIPAPTGKTHYVAGLLFSMSLDRVVLIHKTRGPQNIVGKWNAVGGHVEADETSREAMVREFEEETGQRVESWLPFLQLRGETWTVDFYHAFDDVALSLCKTTEDEQVGAFRLYDLQNRIVTNIVPNLRWIIPMGHI